MKHCAILLGIILAGTAAAKSPSPGTTSQAHIRFTLEDHQFQPSSYSLEINEDGSGTYVATYATSVGTDPGVQELKQAIHVHDPLLSQLFRAARAEHFFGSACENGRGRVAFTGKKTLAYAGPDGSGSCTFNYARQQRLNQLTSKLEAIGYTLQVGKRLKMEQRYDRLSLDGELESLQQAVRDGRALETDNITPVLESIAGDDAVMNLARARARALLATIVAHR